MMKNIIFSLLLIIVIGQFSFGQIKDINGFCNKLKTDKFNEWTCMLEDTLNSIVVLTINQRVNGTVFFGHYRTSFDTLGNYHSDTIFTRYDSIEGTSVFKIYISALSISEGHRFASLRESMQESQFIYFFKWQGLYYKISSTFDSCKSDTVNSYPMCNFAMERKSAEIIRQNLKDIFPKSLHRKMENFDKLIGVVDN